MGNVPGSDYMFKTRHDEKHGNKYRYTSCCLMFTQVLTKNILYQQSMSTKDSSILIVLYTTDISLTFFGSTQNFIQNVCFFRP